MRGFVVIALVLLLSWIKPADAMRAIMPQGEDIRNSQPIPHPHLPFDHTAIVAPTNSGKTTFILNFFIHPALLSMYLQYYNYIIIVSTHANEACTTGYELLMARNHHGK